MRPGLNKLSANVQLLSFVYQPCCYPLLGKWGVKIIGSEIFISRMLALLYCCLMLWSQDFELPVANTLCVCICMDDSRLEQLYKPRCMLTSAYFRPTSWYTNVQWTIVLKTTHKIMIFETWYRLLKINMLDKNNIEKIKHYGNLFPHINVSLSSQLIPPPFGHGDHGTYTISKMKFHI